MSSPSSVTAQHARAGAKTMSSTTAKNRFFAESVLSGGCYCAASITLVLINKLALQGFKAVTSLLLFQCFCCVVMVGSFSALKIIDRPKTSFAIVRAWIPVNICFVAMIWTSFAALAHLSVPTMTVLKNLSNLFTITGDYFFYGRTYNAGVWATLVLMAVSATLGGITDLEFSARGYAWQVLNCLFTSGYSLYLRGVMDKVSGMTPDKKPLDQLTMVFLNNALSMPLLLLTMAANGEAWSVWGEQRLWDPRFQAVALLTGVVSFGISFSSLWFLSGSTPTTYSLVGSLNKVPIALLSLLLFADRNAHNVKNLTSVAVGLAAGVIFVAAKSRDGAAGKGGGSLGSRLSPVKSSPA